LVEEFDVFDLDPLENLALEVLVDDFLYQVALTSAR